MTKVSAGDDKPQALWPIPMVLLKKNEMPTYRQEVHIPTPGRIIPADLVIPGNASAIIVFAHAGAGSRNNRLNKIVAAHLQQKGFGTLLPDLLSEEEVARTREFDITLLAERLSELTNWLHAR